MKFPEAMLIGFVAGVVLGVLVGRRDPREVERPVETVKTAEEEMQRRLRH